MAIVIYFFAFAAPGLHSFFSQDDLMNLGRVQGESITTVLRWNVLYFSPAYRPLGALYYRAFYEWFGLNALPLRIVAFAFLLAEFWLIYAIARALNGSRETGALAVLLLCFHVNFEPMYYASGMCYDVFCFLFYWAAFLYYIRIRRDRETLRWRQILIIAALYIAALDSKELAVTLPAILIAWELLFHGRKNLFRRAIPAITLGVLTIPYIAGKLNKASVFAGHEAYRPVISFANYWRETENLLREGFYLPDARLTIFAAAIFIVLTAIALLSRSRAMQFCWLVWTIGILPIAFIPTRGIPQAWIPALGFGIILAATLAWVRERFFAPRTWSQAALFILTMAALARIHITHGARQFDTSEEKVIRSVVDQLRANHPPLRKGAKVLVLSDPFPDQFNLSSAILLCLYYHDPDLDITRLNRGEASPDAAAQTKYDWVASFR